MFEKCQILTGVYSERRLLIVVAAVVVIVVIVNTCTVFVLSV